MIKFMGRAVTYVQYMPIKTIKNVITVFAIWCALSTIILDVNVCVGQENDSDNIYLVICDDLVKEAGLASTRGRKLYPYNYYMLMVLDKHMFNKYGWKIVGTIVPMAKTSSSDHNITFLKFSNGARNGL